MVVTSKIYRLYIQTFLPNAKISIEQNPFGWKRDWNDKKLRKERKKHIWKPAAQVTSVYNRPEENPTPSQGSNPAWCQILTIRGHQGTQLGPTCIATLGSKNQGNKNLSMDFLPPSKLDMQRYLMFCCSQEFLGGSCVFFPRHSLQKKFWF